MNKKTLEITLIQISDKLFDMEIHEPESGDFRRIECHYNGERVEVENKEITDEIRSWAEMMLEEKDDADREYKQKCEELKRKCFDLGADAMEDLLGVSLEFETDKAMFEFADDILAQMPDEEFEMLYDRYCGGNDND